MAKVDSLLATLRGEEPSPEEAPPALEAPPPLEAGPGISEEALEPLRQRIEELERKLEEQATEPPLMEPPPLELPPEPPAAPTELTLFMQTRMELLEKKMEMAQQEALRANLILREREEAQRKAQVEVEDLFHTIREQQRTASYDTLLRRQVSAAQQRVRELESRLSLAELRMIPAEDVMKKLETDEGREELRSRLREQMGRLQEGESEEGRPPAPPPPELQAQAAMESAWSRIPRSETRPPGTIRPGPEIGAMPPADLAVVLGRVADLEGKLDEARRQREKEREERSLWEESILASLRASRRQWQKAGGPELLVEAALETMVDSIRDRDELQRELSRIVLELRDEPPDSPKAPALHARLADKQKRMEELQHKIAKEMALIQAWVERNKEKGS